MKTSACKHFLRLMCGCVLVGAMAAPTLAQEAETADSAKASAADKAKVNQAYNKYWRAVASRVCNFEGRYYALPKYDAKFNSSSGINAQQWMKDNEDRADPMMSPPREESEAAADYLPKIAPGEYGRVESFKVEKNLGGGQFVVSEVWIIDEDKFKEQLDKANIRRSHALGGITNSQGLSLSMSPEDAKAYHEKLRKAQRSIRDSLVSHQKANPGVQLRLIGFPLDRPVLNERVSNQPGKQPLVVAIIGPDTEPVEGINTATRYLALPVSRFKTGVNDAQFKAFLTAAGMSVDDFVKAAESASSSDEKGWAAAVTETIYKAYVEKNPVEPKGSRKPAARPAASKDDGKTDQ